MYMVKSIGKTYWMALPRYHIRRYAPISETLKTLLSFCKQMFQPEQIHQEEANDAAFFTSTLASQTVKPNSCQKNFLLMDMSAPKSDQGRTSS